MIRTRGMQWVGALPRAGIHAEVRADFAWPDLEYDRLTRHHVASLMADASTTADALELLDHPSHSFTLDHG